METPKYIYVTTFGLNPLHHPWGCWTTRKCDGIKYLRADLAELTWEDCAGIMDAFFDFMQGIATGRETRRHSKEELYKEVLRRFLESKRIKNEE